MAVEPSAPSDPSDRISALEQQVAALTARLSEQDAQPTPAYGRRDLLRRSGAVLAGAAGAVVLPSLVSPAAAAAGDPVLAGRATDATGAATTLTGGTANDPTLVLANPTQGRRVESTGYAAPTLRLQSDPGSTLGLDPARAVPGELTSSGDYLWYGHVGTQGVEEAVVGAVYTSAFANHLAFVTPRRVLDTRRAGAGLEGGAPNDGRSRANGRFDSAGRLLANTALVLDLSDLVTDGAGVLGNLTVVGPGASGFLAAYPASGDGDTSGAGRPAVSSVNFVRGTPALANFALVALGDGDRISIYTTTTAHVLFDVVAFSVYDPFSAQDPGAGTAGQGARRAFGRR